MISDYQNVEFTQVSKFSQNGKDFALIFIGSDKYRHPGREMIQAMDQVAHVGFSYDACPERINGSGAKVVGTGVVANLQHRPNPAGESFGDMFRYIASAFDRIDQIEPDPQGHYLTFTFVLFDLVHEYRILAWDSWEEIHRFWVEDRKRRAETALMRKLTGASS